MKLVKTPLKVGFLYIEVVNLLFSRHILICNFHDILSFVDSNSQLFENVSMTEGSESLFCWNKHELVEKLLLILGYKPSF